MNLVAAKTNSKEPVLIGCGIFRREIECLIKKNNWLIKTSFLDSALHVDFVALKQNLCAELERHSVCDKFVFYGACHPLMDTILSNSKTFRTYGQNCAEILLGSGLFLKEISHGAFFLLEEWVNSWESTFTKIFGGDRDIVREIFHEESKYILAIKTSCSGNYTIEAERIAQYVDLPLRWLFVELDNLESVLLSSINQIGAKSNE